MGRDHRGTKSYAPLRPSIRLAQLNVSDSVTMRILCCTQLVHLAGFCWCIKLWIYSAKAEPFRYKSGRGTRASQRSINSVRQKYIKDHALTFIAMLF